MVGAIINYQVEASRSIVVWSERVELGREGAEEADIGLIATNDRYAIGAHLGDPVADIEGDDVRAGEVLGPHRQRTVVLSGGAGPGRAVGEWRGESGWR